MNVQHKPTKRSGENEKLFRVRWLEVAQSSGIVHATSPEQAISQAKRELPDIEEEYFGRPHIDSYECFSFDDVPASAVDEYYLQFLLRTLQRNLGKSLSSELNNKSEHISKKGDAI